MKDSKGPLRNVRVLKKNMIFLQSYDEHIPTSTLKIVNTFTPCGQVQSVKAKQNFKNSTTYVTYKDEKAAASALLAFTHLSSRLRVLFGTVQYCKYFIRKSECRNQGCVFLHLRDRKNQIIVNDQINQTVYDDHYDMALQLIEPQQYLFIRNILQNDSLEEHSLVRRGLRRAAESLSIDLLGTPKATRAKGSQLSTQESDLCHDQIFQKSIGQEHSSSRQEQNIASEQVTSDDYKEYSDDYVSIRIIKQLLRQQNSKKHTVSSVEQDQGLRRGKMILYQMVKY